MKKFRWDKKYLYWGVTAVFVIIASILFYTLFNNFSSLRTALERITTILSPFIWGLVITYLLCPLVRIYQRVLFTPLANAIVKKKPHSVEKSRNLAKGLSVFLAEISLLIIFAALIWLIVPQIYLSIESIVLNSSDYIKTIYDWFDKTLANYPEINEYLTEVFGDVSQGLFDWIKNSVLPEINSLITNVTSGVYYVVKGIYNVIIGMIVSVYVLYNKETFAAHIKKLIYCVFSVEAAEKILNGIKFIDNVFIGFISGKILDSAIIGVICYVVCIFVRIPYAMLVSVVIGITNIIPFFGPIIGLLPTALIILMVSPIKCLVFVIFIIVLQQFDGNVLGPKILGSSVGVNGFWIMFSIIVGAGLFGFMGMMLGVPVFVIIYAAVKTLVDRKLKRSGLPTETSYYANMTHIDPKTGEPIPHDETRRRKQSDGRKGLLKREKTDAVITDSAGKTELNNNGSDDKEKHNDDCAISDSISDERKN